MHDPTVRVQVRGARDTASALQIAIPAITAAATAIAEQRRADRGAGQRRTIATENCDGRDRAALRPPRWP